MRTISCFCLAVGFGSSALGGGKPLATVPHYSGKFIWVKLGDLPAASLKSLEKAKKITVDLSFKYDVILQKDKGGNHWFTFLLADQGSDWKWHQTSTSAVVPSSSGVIKAGVYSISWPISGLPKSVLGDKKQTISLGAGTSGLASAVSFTVDGLRGR